jgi:hypothetical protein
MAKADERFRILLESAPPVHDKSKFAMPRLGDLSFSAPSQRSSVKVAAGPRFEPTNGQTAGLPLTHRRRFRRSGYRVRAVGHSGGFIREGREVEGRAEAA